MMHKLISLLQSLDQQNPPTEVNEAIGMAQQLVADNDRLHQEVVRLSQIISDIRERDANKKCLCRGFS